MYVTDMGVGVRNGRCLQYPKSATEASSRELEFFRASPVSVVGFRFQADARLLFEQFVQGALTEERLVDAVLAR